MAAISQTTFSNAFPWKKNIPIAINISLKLVPRDQINNIPALVQIMAWGWSGDKPLFEPMMLTLLMHIWVTRLQQVNPLKRSEVFIPENNYKFTAPDLPAI